MKKLLVALALFLITVSGYSQTNDGSDKKIFRYSNKWTLGTDLAQPFLLGGLNLNVSYTTNRMIFDWSHGIGLEIPESIQSSEQKDLKANIKLPWTTGPGIGYRWTENLDARIDFKAHKTEVDLLNGQQKLDYIAYTVGPGVYYRFYFGKKTGFGLEASARYWFELGNDLDGLDESEFKFTDSQGNQRKFDTNINGGIGVNVALIYTFGKSK